MQRLLIATHNKGKVKELSDFLSDLPLELVSLSDLNITEDVEEDGETYEENSQKKALFYAKISGLPAVADDGGLEIAALGGAPGVKSKRWLGYEATGDELVAHLKKVSQTLPDDNRTAYFRVVLTLAMPDGKVWSVMGETEGIIAKKSSGVPAPGLQYRMYFYIPEIKKYYNEKDLTRQEMERYSHRYIACNAIKPVIIKQLHITW